MKNTDENNVEFLAENLKLKNILTIINNETLDYISKRQYIYDYIKKYREKMLEEFKYDEDKITEYFDHELYVKEELYRMIDKKLKELTILKDSPYFGRISFEEESDGYLENMYIGRFGLAESDSYEPEIIDWRAPIASLFYHGSLGEAQYDSPNGKINVDIKGRRQIIIKNSQLKGVFDSAIDIKDDILQMVLSSNTSDKLQDIVMTIQKEQDEIIRSDRKKTIVVNGVAGSGKTTIALHRVAYLLYNFRKQLEGKVLILGPNSIFMEYISQVLPTLGETGVDQQSFTNFAIQEIDLKEPIIELNQYVEKILNGDIDFIDDVKKKYSDDFIIELDKFVKHLEKEYFKLEPIKFFDEVIVDIPEIKEMFDSYYSYMPLFRRSQKIKRILISKVKDKRDELVYRMNKEIEEYKASLSEEHRNLEELNIEYKRKLRIREIIREVMNIKESLNDKYDNKDIVALYKDFTKTNTLSVADLAPILYLMVKLDGKKTEQEFNHIIIDESQDYSTLQFKVIKELTGCNHYTIVGDVNQRIIKFSEEVPMMKIDEIFEDNNVKYYSLNKSYRSTNEIMEYANNYLDENRIVPLVRNGRSVDEVLCEDDENISKEIIKTIKELKDDGFASIAVITRDEEDLVKIHSLIKDKVHIFKFDNEYLIYRGGTVIIPSYYAKGLEFDAVIMINNKKDKEDNLLKYIIATRALHYLKVVEV